MFQLEIGGEMKKYPQGTSYAEIVWEYQKSYEQPIVLVSINGRLRELHKKVEQDGRLEFITAKDTAGHSTLVRGMIFVMMRAMYKVSGRIFEENAAKKATLADGAPESENVDDAAEKGRAEYENDSGNLPRKAENESRGGNLIGQVRMEYSLGAGLYGGLTGGRGNTRRWKIFSHR